MDCQGGLLSIFVGYILCYKDCAGQFICVILIPTTFLVRLARITFAFKTPFSHSQCASGKRKEHESGSMEIRRLGINIHTQIPKGILSLCMTMAVEWEPQESKYTWKEDS